MKKIVLVVDDEPMIRDLLRHMLEDLGFVVFSRERGEDALVEIGGVDAVITDFDMSPGMNGAELAKLAKSQRPDLPVLILTATPGDVPLDHTADAVFYKPFRVMEILKWLREVLK